MKGSAVQILIALAALLSLALTTGAGTSLSIDKYLIVPGDRIGAFRLGAPAFALASAAHDVYGLGEAEVLKVPGSTFLRYCWNPVGVCAFLITRGPAVLPVAFRIDTWSKQFRTQEGISIGSRAKEALSRFGKPIDRINGEGESGATWPGITVVWKNRTGRIELIQIFER